jgi:SPW repeat
MATRSVFRWQNLIIMILSMWLALSPWLLGYVDSHPWATYNAVVAGVALLLVEAIAVDTPHRWTQWAALAVGLWVIVFAFASGLTTHGPGLAGKLAAGVLVAALAAWTMRTSGHTGARTTDR